MSVGAMLVALAIALLSLGVTMHLGVSAWAKIRRIENDDKRGLAPPVPDEVLQRLERIEHIVEATAIEVERVAEAQRYVAKQMSEQTAPRIPSPRSVGKVDTPH